MQLNTQKSESREHRTDGRLDVVGIWDTFQGEGPFAGVPAVFVRLAGCNLECRACDTDYTSDRKSYTPIDILMAVKLQADNRKLIVLTGGEPFRQNIIPFIDAAMEDGYTVQIETNGVYPIPYRIQSLAVRGRVVVVCSPKTPKIHEDIFRYAACLKYVVAAEHIDKETGLPLKSVGLQYGAPAPKLTWPDDFGGHVYIQPLDEQDEEKNHANLQAAIASCQEHGYTLCLQLHKIIGVD